MPSCLLQTKASFCIQVYSIPQSCMTVEVGSLIKAWLGKLFSIDYGDSGLCWWRFMRLRLSIDVTKPFQRGMKLQLDDNSSCWDKFKYERLSGFDSSLVCKVIYWRIAMWRCQIRRNNMVSGWELVLTNKHKLFEV